MQKMHEIDMEHAGLLRRYLAFLIDSLICYIIIGNIAVSIIDQSKMQFIGLSIFFLYFSIEGSWLKGQSLGKKIFKIRYIAVDKSPIKPKHYLLRATIIAFSFSMPFYEAVGSQIQAVSYALIILLLWMSIFIYPVFHPQNRSLLDIVNQLIIVKDMRLSHQSLMVQGPVRLANLLTMLAFIIISSTAYTIFVAPINNLNSQIQEAKTVAKALSQINNRDVSVQINYPLDRDTGVKRALLVAVVHLHEDELSSYESDPKLRSPYFLNYYRRMQELNDNPQISYLQVILTTKKRFGYFYPIKYNLAGKVIPNKGAVS